MIENLNEINRVLVVIEKLSNKQKGASLESVLRFCRSPVVEARFPNHKDTINFLLKHSIISKYKKRLKLTSLGIKFLRLNPNFNYQLSSAQKELLVKECFLSNDDCNSHLVKLLRQFSPAYSKGTYQWSIHDDLPFKGNMNLLRLMQQTGLIVSKDNVLEIDRKYVKLVRNIRKHPNVITPDELSKKLKKAIKVGGIAEELALNFEKLRLKNIDCFLESECIQRISELDVSAGYDIASFDCKCISLNHDRFIEVKGSTSSELDFYWSKNEIMTAKTLGSKYWIYFFPEVDIEKKQNKSNPILIQNPAQTLLENKDYTVDCVQFHVKNTKTR